MIESSPFFGGILRFFSEIDPVVGALIATTFTWLVTAAGAYKKSGKSVAKKVFCHNFLKKRRKITQESQIVKKMLPLNCNWCRMFATPADYLLP